MIRSKTRKSAFFVVFIVLLHALIPGRAAAEWTARASMHEVRSEHTATLLKSGAALIVGGFVLPAGSDKKTLLKSAEIYDPVKDAWELLPDAMSSARYGHTATPLDDGRVLVTGGFDGDAETASAEIYDPGLKIFTAIPPMNEARAHHTAISIGGGRVLIAGGSSAKLGLSSAEIFEENPKGVYTFTPTSGPMSTGRFSHAIAPIEGTTLVMVAGGYTSEALPTNSVEMYDAATDAWSVSLPMNVARAELAATWFPDGSVLVVGGSPLIVGSELRRPMDGKWETVGIASENLQARLAPTATTLHDGRVVVAGGSNASSVAADVASVFDYRFHFWYAVTSPIASLRGRTATLLSDDKVLLAGGATNGAETYEITGDFWAPQAPMLSSRGGLGAAALDSGDALVFGGYSSLSQQEVFGPPLANTEKFVTESNMWSDSAPMKQARYHFTTTTLNDGSILVAGGRVALHEAPLPDAETYSPTMNAWQATPPMQEGRTRHAAALLNDGKVLVAGGFNSKELISSSAEIYDPTSRTWSQTGSLLLPRAFARATTLTDGRVLITGGQTVGAKGGSAAIPLAEIYDPATGTFTPSTSMIAARYVHTATRLKDGRVLITGGYLNQGEATESAEIYEPITDRFTPASSMEFKRSNHEALLLQNGFVLVAGTEVSDGPSSTAVETYDPVANRWETSARMRLNEPRAAFAMVPIAGGDVLVAGGTNVLGVTTGAERFHFRPFGASCSSAGECASGFCADGVCCNEACDGAGCDACSVAEGADTDGTCKALIECEGDLRCDATTSACPSQCESTAQCVSGFVCDPSNRCVPTPAPASTNDDATCAAGRPSPSEAPLQWPLGLGALALTSLALRRRRRTSTRAAS